MTPEEMMRLATESAQQQIDLNRQVLVNHLDASDRIHLRRASEAMTAAAVTIASDPTN